MLTRFARSTRVPMDGSSPCFVRRRRSASAAERYCVGSTPKPRNTFRHAASVGSSLRGVSPIRANAPTRLVVEGLGESRSRRVVVDAGCVDDAADDRRKALDDVRVITEASHWTQSRRPAAARGRPSQRLKGSHARRWARTHRNGTGPSGSGVSTTSSMSRSKFAAVSNRRLPSAS